MPLDINKFASTDQYSGNDFRGEWGSGYLAAAGADILVKVGYGTGGAISDTITDKTLFANQTFNFVAPQGKELLEVAFKSAVAGTPATVSGYFSERNSLGILTTIGGAGTVTSKAAAASLITGIIPAAGTVPTAGTGFTYTHTNGTGIYVFSFTTAFASTPTIVAVSNDSTLANIAWVSAISPNGFQVDMDQPGVAHHDAPFSFIAQATA